MPSALRSPSPSTARARRPAPLKRPPHLNSWGQEATNEVAQPRPVYRYLFLVDTSSAMSRQKDLTMDTVSRLILSGIGSRIHTGEFWNIWTFADQLHTNGFPAQMWDLHERPDVADRA